ncbi:unnamed protein product [Caenorhabditis sp. 36 PRJEB53466]|nr:unnamed protein product [Caenorhabditis sp. 36 PRJEB53466]
MASVKWTMLVMHICGAYLDLFLSALSTQYYLLPAAAGHASGLYTFIGIPVKWQAYMFISAICLAGVAILGFFESREEAVDVHWRALPVRVHFILPITFTPPEQEYGKAYVREKLPCVPQYVLDHPNFFVYAIDITLLTGLIGFATITITSEVVYFFVRILIHLSSTKAKSQRTYTLQLQFFIALSVQISIPLMVVIVPVGYIVFAFSSSYFDQGKQFSKKVFCRYFDCHRREIQNSAYASFFFPMTAVHCVRRAGAEFMSITFGKHDEPQEPIPIIKRMYSRAPHEIGVCVGQIYGEERKWLEIIEFVEHHRLIGASIFYFTVYEMDGYTKKVIEEYERLGLAEASFVNTGYRTINILFHQIQLHECFFRSKFHSKWVINVDIDERLTLTEPSLFPSFLSRRVAKFEKDPEAFESEERLLKDMEFIRYQNTTEALWPAPKIVFRPDKVHNIYTHWSWKQHPGCRITSIPYWVGYVRHYRFVNKRGLGSNWLNQFNTSFHFPLNPQFAETLKIAVVAKVKYLYDLKPIPCEKIEQFFKKNYLNDTLKCVENE